jgi:hypothetical protein
MNRVDERVEDQLVTVADDEQRPPCERPYPQLFGIPIMSTACRREKHPADWTVEFACGCLHYACDTALAFITENIGPQDCEQHGGTTIVRTWPL